MTIASTSPPPIPDLTDWFSTTMLVEAVSWSTLGYILVAVGLIATLLSSHRYLLVYLLAGMAYWLLVEGLQFVISHAIAISSWHSYLAALAITWFIPSLFLVYRYGMRRPSADTPTKPRWSTVWQRKSAADRDNYIEHTPIYNNYKPRFDN